MTRLLPILFAALLTMPVVRAGDAPGDDAAWAPHRALRVLYAGWPDGSREKAFAAFLRQWFDRVGVIGLKDLSMDTAAEYDVVVADWCSQYGNDGYPEREGRLYGVPVRLGPEFTKPVVAMDYTSSQLRAGYKLDWL